MQKRIALALILLPALAPACRLTPVRSVAGSLTAATKSAPDGAEIRMSSLTDFAWSSFVAFGPYTTRPMAEEVLGFAWPVFDEFDLEVSDGFILMVFVDGDRVVVAEKLRRCRPDFAQDVLGRRLSPKTAVFTLQKETGCDVLKLRSAD